MQADFAQQKIKQGYGVEVLVWDVEVIMTALDLPGIEQLSTACAESEEMDLGQVMLSTVATY